MNMIIIVNYIDIIISRVSNCPSNGADHVSPKKMLLPDHEVHARQRPQLQHLTREGELQQFFKVTVSKISITMPFSIFTK